MKNRKIWLWILSASTLCFLGSPSFSYAEKAAGPKNSPPPNELTTAIADVAQKAIPTVVHIEVTQRVEVPLPSSPFESDPFFRYFFGGSQGSRRDRREMHGIGTGMIIDSEGHILTNHHVVSGATKISITMDSGEEFEAKIVGTDPKTDLAVIKIAPPQNIHFLTFGNSDKLRVGEWVVAIGNPRGLEHTVTAGIISAKHRAGISDPSSYQDYIQTDAALNPGNSGGPLLNLNGEVVGVNAAIISESGGFEGISFAIPSNMAMGIVEALIKTGKVVRGWLGLSIQEMNPSLARTMNLPVSKGALVTEVFKGGPAEKAGIRQGDFIDNLDGIPLESANDFRNRLAASRVGKSVEIGVWRKGENVLIQAVVEAYKPLPRTIATDLNNKLGIAIKEISIMEARRKQLDSREGVIVTKVDNQGAGGRAGIEPGDIIYQINNHTVRSLRDYNRIIEKIPRGEEILLLIRDTRSGEVGYLTLVTNE